MPIKISAQGDTLTGNVDFHTVYPATAPVYAKSADWFVNNEPVRFAGHLYFKYALPFKVSPAEVRMLGLFRDTQVYGLVREGFVPVPDAVLIPIQPGCEFQLYMSGP